LSTAASSYTAAAAANLMRSFDPASGKFDIGAFAKSLYSTETLAGTLGAMAGSGLAALAGTAMPLSSQKLYGGLVNLGAAGAGEAARYSVYALDSMVNGSGDFMDRLGQAYDNMGGVTLNIANLGSILDLAGTMSFRLGENYDTKLGVLGGRLSGAGLLELNFGRGGSSLSLGMNGIDAGGSLYSSVKHGLDYMSLMYGDYEGAEYRDVLISNYLNGDWAAENTSMRIMAGSDILRILSPETMGINNFGQTTRRTDAAGRLITMADTGNANTNALILQHESLRNGYIPIGNETETIAAALAHTTMAARMMRDGADFTINEILLKDLMVYYGTGGDMAAFSRYVLENYDSSGDNWLVKMNGAIVGTPNDPRIYREVYNDGGEIVNELVPGSDEKGSQAASLVALLGEERVRELLHLPAGNNINISEFDRDAIAEILGYHNIDLLPAYISENMFSYLDDLTRRKILGETLLRQNSYSWNEDTKMWDGESLNIAMVDTEGAVGIVKKDNVYVPFSVTSTLYRTGSALKQYVYEDGQWKEDRWYRANTTAAYTYKNLITGENDTYFFQGPLNFVDILDGSNPNTGGANQPYNHPVYGTIQGATVASPALNQRIVTGTSYGTALLFSDYTDLKGDFFGKSGQRAGIVNDPRTLYHWTVNGYSDSCLVSFSLKGGLSGYEYFTMNMDYLQNSFNVYKGLEIKTRLIDFSR
jgi:hypothetical protein